METHHLIGWPAGWRKPAAIALILIGCAAWWVNGLCLAGITRLHRA